MLTLRHNNQAFTVVELLIATAIFTVVLLLATMSLIQIGKVYYKGINSIATQNAARSVIDDVSQAIQFSGAGNLNLNPTDTGVSNIFYFCTNEKRYAFVTSKQLKDNNTSHVFMSDNDPIQNGCVDPDGWLSGPGATELLSPGMRLVNFDLNQTPGIAGLYNVKIRIAFGDDDLLCSPSGPPAGGDCSSTNTSTNLTNKDLTCKVFAGKQFCNVTELSTSVLKRL